MQINIDEWWFKGCFIQEQFNPKLKPYYVFKDTENQETIGSCYTFLEAKKLCKLNEVKDYKEGWKSFM